jgi:hypothetical protein
VCFLSFFPSTADVSNFYLAMDNFFRGAMSAERKMEVGRYNQDKKQYLNCVCVNGDGARGEQAAGW